MNYNVIGINEAGIEKMKAAVDNYIKAIKNSSNIEASETEIKKAVKGSNVEMQIKTLAAKVDKHIDDVVNEMTVFKTKIDSVKSSYARYDSNSSSIQNAANKLKS